MNNRLIVRKTIYLALIAALLIPLYLLGQPSTKMESGEIREGGKLATLRSRYRIGQAELGQIDPASESMRLATLGMRGLAVAWLWQKAEYYREEKFFDRLSATLNQISLLQPHFIKVWESQAHNLAYNVSAEFDDYRQRYAWVKKGLDYLIRGTEYNERQPILQWYLGRYTTTKIGKSDEKLQFRELFRNDTDYHDYLQDNGLSGMQSEALGPDRKPDNWLTGRLWFLKAYDLVASGALISKPDVFLYGEAPWAQLYYAEAIEEEGVLDDRARFAWARAHDAWLEYGDRDIMTTAGTTIQLRSVDRLNAQLAEAREDFDAMTVEAQRKTLESYREGMNRDQQYILDKDPAQFTDEEREYFERTKKQFLTNLYDVANFVPSERRSEVIAKVTEIRNLQQRLEQTESYRNMSNYAYWDMRGEAEQSPVTLAARQQMYRADKLIDQADLQAATANYEKAWLNWNAVFHRYPAMMLEPIADDVIEAVNRYLSATDTEFDESFPLKDFMDYRAVYKSNRLDSADNEWYQRLLEEAPRWASAMDRPALLDNDHVPQPDDSPQPAASVEGDAASPTADEPSDEPSPGETPPAVVDEVPPPAGGEAAPDAAANGQAAGGTEASAASEDHPRPPTLQPPE